jgi:ketosteroid isomerase-like protein
MPDLGVPLFAPSIADDNAELIRSSYDAFARGDVDAVLASFADDILWHVPGRGPLSGDYRGRAEVLGFFGAFMKLSNGTFHIYVDDILAKGETVVALVTESAQRGGRSWSSPQAHVWTVQNGRITRFWQYQGDQQTEDEFWAAAA